MSNDPYSIRTVSQGAEAQEVRTLVFDEEFKLRPLKRGQSVGDDPGERLFQEVFRGDYIVTTSRKDRKGLPYLRVTRHRDATIAGTFAAEVLNRIDPILARYLMDYKL